MIKRAVFAAGLMIAGGMSASHAATVPVGGCGLGQLACFSVGYLSGIPVGIANSQGLSLLGGSGWDDASRAAAGGSAKSKKTVTATDQSKAIKTNSPAKKNARSRAPATTSKVALTVSQSGLLGIAIAEQFAKTLAPVPKSPPGQSDKAPPLPVVVQVPELDRPRNEHPESNVVPIPPAVALFLTGFGMLVAWSRRRKIAA